MLDRVCGARSGFKSAPPVGLRSSADRDITGVMHNGGLCWRASDAMTGAVVTMPVSGKPPVAFIGLGKWASHGREPSNGPATRGGLEPIGPKRPRRCSRPARASRPRRPPPPRLRNILVSSLADDASLRAVVSGPAGLLAGLRPVRSTSVRARSPPASLTNWPASTRRRGGRYVAGPVVGACRPPRRRNW